MVSALLEAARAQWELAKPAPAVEPAGKVLIAGVSSTRSLGFIIGEHMKTSGWETVLTTRRADKLAATLAGHDVRVLDYPDDTAVLSEITGLTGLVFCLAKTDVTERGRGLLGVSAENFLQTLYVSSYAFIEIVREVQARNPELRSIVALSFLGGERIVKGYEVIGVAKAALEHSVRTLASELGPLGIRVNAVSAGSVPTPSSRVLPDFRRVHSVLAERSFLRRNTCAADVAHSVGFLLGEGGRGVTGEVLQVNGGLSHTVI